MAMTNWSSMLPGGSGRELRRTILCAMREAYDENVRRYSPDDLGDNNVTFGVSVSHNLRHLVERDTSGFVDVEAQRPRNSFRLRVPGGLYIYLYKAPPGAVDIRGLAFDDSELKLEIRQVNADQLSFDLGELASTNTTMPRATNIVVVHFGDPTAGFGHAEIGAPYSTTTGDCDWAWHEPFEDDEDDYGDLDGDGAVVPDEPRGGEPNFGLQLREQADDDVAETS